MSWERFSKSYSGDALTALSVSRHDLRRGCLVVVRGPRGIGKTRLMAAAAARRSRAQGPVALAWIDGEACAERCGVDEVLRVLRENFSRFGTPGLIDSISALVRLRDEESAKPSMNSDAVSAELWTAFGRLGARGSTMIVVDDATHIVDVADLVLAARRPGCLVVAAVHDDGKPLAAELVALADQVIDLRPLTDVEVEEMTGGVLHSDVHHALRTALGPLYGNPVTVLSTVEELKARGWLHSVDGRVHLRDASVPIPLPSGHHLLERTRAHGGLTPLLVALVAATGVLSVDELPRLADNLGEDLDACGRTLDRLVEIGALESDEWGRVRCPCPALATSLAAGEPGVAQRVRDAAVAITEPARGLACATAVPPRRPTDHGSLGEPVDPRPWSVLDTRIVELIAAGLTNRRIASELAVSEKTVEAHLTRLFSRTGCRSRVELIAERRAGGSRVGRRRVAA